MYRYIYICIYTIIYDIKICVIYVYKYIYICIPEIRGNPSPVGVFSEDSFFIGSTSSMSKPIPIFLVRINMKKVSHGSQSDMINSAPTELDMRNSDQT
jgi:hypothetical protein